MAIFSFHLIMVANPEKSSMPESQTVAAKAGKKRSSRQGSKVICDFLLATLFLFHC